MSGSTVDWQSDAHTMAFFREKSEKSQTYAAVYDGRRSRHLEQAQILDHWICPPDFFQKKWKLARYLEKIWIVSDQVELDPHWRIRIKIQIRSYRDVG